MEGPIPVTLAVIRVLDDLKIPYAIGGSLASSMHGIPRATRDADLVADLQLHHVPSLVKALQGDFYVSEEAVCEAITHRSSFNVIHLASNFKVDIFIKQTTPFAKALFDRRQLEPVTGEPTPRAYVSSPEDILLTKLVWYRQGGEASERQWSDVLGIIKVQGSRLDHAYLAQWAPTLSVRDLLDRALSESGASS